MLAVKEYFMNYFLHNTDVTVNLADNSTQLLENHSEDWKVTMVDTGLNTMTAGRLKRVRPYIGEETFCLTYGDGVTDLDITDTIEKHKESGKALSMTVYKPAGRFGSVHIDPKTNTVLSFEEKPDGEGNWINAGFFVCEPKVFDFLPGDADPVMFERQPLENIAKAGEMHAYKHSGFWKPMDMLKDSISETVDRYLSDEVVHDNWNIDGLRNHYLGFFTTPEDFRYTADELANMEKKDLCSFLNIYCIFMNV